MKLSKMKLSNRFSAMLIDVSMLTVLGNAGNKAHFLLTNPGKTEADYVPYGTDSLGDVQNNAIIVKAIASASLAIAKFREDTSDEMRLRALHDIAEWNLNEEEAMMARFLANAAWWGRSESRSLARLTEQAHNHGDFDDLSSDEKAKDDAVLKAVAKEMLIKLG